MRCGSRAPRCWFCARFYQRFNGNAMTPIAASILGPNPRNRGLFRPSHRPIQPLGQPEWAKQGPPEGIGSRQPGQADAGILIAAGGRLAVPLDGLLRVLRDPSAALVGPTQIILRPALVSIGSVAKPEYRLGEIARHAPAVDIEQS